MADGENLLDRLKAAIENHHLALSGMKEASVPQNAGADVVAASARVEKLARYEVVEATGEPTPSHSAAYKNTAVAVTRS